MSAGDNLVLTLPNGEAELKASVEPAPPAGESLVFLVTQTGHSLNIPQWVMVKFC